MRGQSIFVLIFLSFAGKTVLGSLFPATQNGPPPSLDSVTTQQEVKWPLENIATPAEVIVPAEAKIYSRGFQAELTKDGNLKSGSKSAEISSKITTNQDPESQSGIQNSAESVTNISRYIINLAVIH